MFDGYTRMKTQAHTHAGKLPHGYVCIGSHTNVIKVKMMKPKWKEKRGEKGRELMD